MNADETACPDPELLELVLQGRAPAERGEALARHVETCPGCSARIEALRMAPPPPRPRAPAVHFTRPWKAYFAFAAALTVVFTAIYCVIEQIHRDR